MERRRVLLAFALLLVPSLAGCFSDLKRVRLETRWQANGTLATGPTMSVAGAPAQLVVSGSLSIEPAIPVELTGFEATLESANRSVTMHPARLTVGNRTLDAQEAVDDNLELAHEDAVQLTLLPSKAEGTRLIGEGNRSVEVALQYRYRQGDRFDAGRFRFEANLTPEPPSSLGIGVARTNGSRITGLVFETIGLDAQPGRAGVQVFHVTGAGPSLSANRTVQFEAGEGVVTGELNRSVQIPEGSGYLLLRVELGPLHGVVVHADRSGEQALPFPSPLALLAIAGSLAVLARRRRTGSER